MRAIIPSVAQIARVAAASMRRPSEAGQLIHLGSFRPKRAHPRICTASADANFLDHERRRAIVQSTTPRPYEDQFVIRKGLV